MTDRRGAIYGFLALQIVTWSAIGLGTLTAGFDWFAFLWTWTLGTVLSLGMAANIYWENQL